MKKIPTPPVIVLAGVLVCTAIVVEIARIALFEEGEYIPQPPQVRHAKHADGDRTFKDLHKKFPAWKLSQQEKHKPVDIPLFAHNIVENKSEGSVILTIFTDHASQVAREQEMYIKDMIKGTNKYHVQTNYKFMPYDADATDGGLFEQIAYRNGVYNKYKILLHEAKGNLSGDHFIDLLEKSGIPLAELRNIMRRDMGVMLKWLEADIQQAKQLEITDVPVFFLNGHRLGTPDLPYHKVNLFVSRLLQGNEIWEESE
jgi:hypothetical protein